MESLTGFPESSTGLGQKKSIRQKFTPWKFQQRVYFENWPGHKKERLVFQPPAIIFQGFRVIVVAG